MDGWMGMSSDGNLDSHIALVYKAYDWLCFPSSIESSLAVASRAVGSELECLDGNEYPPHAACHHPVFMNQLKISPPLPPPTCFSR
jgi:hypothetical protein